MSVFLPKRNQLAGLTNHDNAIRMITHELVGVVTLHCTHELVVWSRFTARTSWQGWSRFTARELVGVVTLHCM